MDHFVQYHNVDKRGLHGLLTRHARTSISTARPSVRNARGIVFLIVGLGRPRQYYLWEAFRIERVRQQPDGTFRAQGPVFHLAEPVLLAGREFDQFRRACANLIGFRQIDSLPYVRHLQSLLGPALACQPGPLPERFLRQLLTALKPNSESHTAVRQALGLASQSRESSAPPASRRSLRTLSVCQPQAEAIMRGTKRIEYRTMPTRVRERIQIYASRTRYSAAEEARRMRELRLTDVSIEELPRGKLIGTVELVDCTFDGELYHWHLRAPERAKKLLSPRRRPQPVWFYPF